MKTLLRKKWFRRLCQTLLALCSLLALAYVAIDWRGARMKRDVIAQMRAEGRPTSVAEMLKLLPRDEDNFAMIPILTQAGDEWWNDPSNRNGSSPDQARVKLRKMCFKTGKKEFAREGKPDLSIWKKNLELTGSDAECLDAYDHKFGEILAELHSGMSRPETVSSMLHRLAASSDTDWLGLTSGYVLSLKNVAESLGFRAELALAADRPELAYESLSMAIRLSVLAGSEGTLVSQLCQSAVIRALQPTLARALQTAGWDKARISSIRNELAAVNALDGFRRALDVENFTSFAMFEGARKRGQYNMLIDTEGGTWKREFLIEVAEKLPIGWYQRNAALWARVGLQLRGELGEGGNLRAWFLACERAEKRGQVTSSWDSWLNPILNNNFGATFKRACRDQTIIQQAVLACDLETYRLDHGHYPERLQEINSPAIVDSMTGEPFRYQITESGYLLYSIGSDATDNGGNRSKQDNYYKRDWVW